MEEIRMKLFKKVMTLVAIMFVVFAMTGCAELLGKIKQDIDEIPEADTPYIEYEAETDVTVRLGGAVTLKIKSTVTDGGTLSYQWYKGSSENRNEAEPITAAILPTYAYIASLKAEDDGKVEYYWCKVVNVKNAKTTTEWSGAFKVTIQEPTPETPVIIQEEKYSFDVHYNTPVTLTVRTEMEDLDLLTYVLSFQWYKGSTDKRENAQLISKDDEATAVLPVYIFTTPEKPEIDGVTTYYWCKVTNKNIKSGKTVDAWSEPYSVKVSNIIRIDGEYITDVTVWNSCYTYYIDDWLIVNNSLTIPDGTIIKLGKDAHLTTSTNGTITVNGSAENPVYFTSYRDESKGIAIPEFIGKATNAQKGDWAGVTIGGEEGSEINYAVFRYAWRAGLTLNATTTVNNCIFMDNKYDYNAEGPSAALIINESANESDVTENKFYNNDYPLRVCANYTVDTSNIFHNPDSTDGNIKNVYQAIVVETGRTIEQGNTVEWMITELPYYVTGSGSHWINVDGTLKIGDDDAKVIVKFDAGGEINVNQTGYFTLGSNSILTSWKDNNPDHGEDIWAGKDVGPVERGDWEGINIYGSEEWGWGNAINKDKTRVWYNNPSNYETNDD